jgi:glutamine synthetase
MNFAARHGLLDDARRLAIAEALRLASSEPVHKLRVSWPDLHGTWRGKTLFGEPVPLEDVLVDGIGMVSTLLLKDSADRTAFRVFEPGGLDGLPGFGAANNLVLLPDGASFRRLPWAPDTAWLRAEPWWDDGRPVEADPRRVLQRALAELAAAGYGLKCGLELEFHVFRIVADGLPAEAAAWPPEPPPLRHLHPGYKLLAEDHADLADEALDIVRSTAQGLGLPLRSLEIELGPSQVEAVFAPTDALTAADQMALFRGAVRQALRRKGYLASFVCRPPLPNTIASGWHLHQSLVDLHGNPVMALAAAAPPPVPPVPQVTPGRPDDARQLLSDAGVHWLAGLLAHARGLAALCAPTIPAYARYRGSVMAPQSVGWARDNRGALLRVLGGPGDPDTRLENRLGEPMANPHLAIAAQMAAGLHGLRAALQPPPATSAAYGDGAPALPASLAEALDALAADAELQQALGPSMALIFETVKRQEIARHAEAVDDLQWQRREYLGRF